jgi:hypothetical protein
MPMGAPNKEFALAWKPVAQDKRKSCEVEAGRELGGRQSVSAPFVVSARLRPRR